VLEESESDLVIRVTDMAITHTAATAAIIRMAITGRISPTATILGGHTTGTTDTVIIATTVIITTIGTKLIWGIKPTELAWRRSSQLFFCPLISRSMLQLMHKAA